MNEILLEDIFYLGTFPIIAAVIHHFFNRCLKCKIKKPVYITLVYTLYCAVSSGLYFLPLTGYYKLFLNFVLIVGLSFFYRRMITWRVGASVFIMAVILLSDILAQSVLQIFIASEAIVIYLMSLFLSKIIMLVLEYIAVQLFDSYGEGRLSGWYWLVLILCPLMSCIGMYSLSKQLSLSAIPTLYLTFALGLIFINYFVFMICDHILHKQSVEKQTLLLEQQVEYYANQYQLAENTQKEILKFRHDFKNILVGLQTELEAGKVSEGKNTIQGLIDNFSSSKGIVRSGNIVIDSIINYKQKIADELSVPFHLDLRFPSDIILNTTAISVILGNALDNALNASKQVEKEKTYVKIQIHYENESLFIRIENPYTGVIRTDLSGKIYSTKTDIKSQGIGLKSIEETIDNLHGLLNIDYKDSIFQLEVVLFNVKRESDG